MYKSLVTAVFLLCTLLVSGQEEHGLGVFETDTTWTKEIIEFPIGFAPEIPYEGYEDLRFAAGWAKKDSPEFWTYIFAWYIQGEQPQTANDLETNLKLYFDGLMNVVNENKNITLPETRVSFIKNESGNQDSDFIGKMDVYDSFHTKTVIGLNILVKGYYCEGNNKSIIVFKISPKALEHEMWNAFQPVKIRMVGCKPF